jgi:exopolysaccharide biosynthesis polyprenyl glycosylphosphotransferase
VQWVCGVLIGLTVLVTLRSAEGGATSGEVLSFLSLAAVVGVAQTAARWLPGPISRGMLSAVMAAIALLALMGIDAVLGLEVDFLTVVGALVASGAALTLAAGLARLSAGRVRVHRVAVIGSPRGKDNLRRELELAGIERFEVAGWLPDSVELPETIEEWDAEDFLGTLADLRKIVIGEDIDLLVMTGAASRLTVFNEIARSCLDLPVRFCELSNFHEELFGHVPVTEINTAWFQYLLHPRFNGATPVAKRTVDLLLTCIVSVPAVPLLLVAALLVRRDGGSAFFKQERIGEGGKPFVLYKLRTMKPATDASAQWAGEDDPRITRVGRLLRRSHVDELPQLLNILKGEMSMVGPRPEQPRFVERLEHLVPFYQRRHLIKPGLTGWAQVRCGYAGSDRGSLWKVSHDLYYVKHRALALDLAILWETAVELVSPRPHVVTDAMVGWVFEESEWEDHPDSDGQPDGDGTSAPPSVLAERLS